MDKRTKQLIAESAAHRYLLKTLFLILAAMLPNEEVKDAILKSLYGHRADASAVHRPATNGLAAEIKALSSDYTDAFIEQLVQTIGKPSS
jgi:hypothetical protein